MTDEQDKQDTQPVSDESSDAERPETPEAEQPTGEEGEEHTFKESARGAVAKVVGVAVELGSILGGEGGTIVEAQRDVAEADTEELIDRIDGED
jgi:hypothetical protein